MEDAATAEISRSQVWQQIRNGVVLADTGNTVTRELVTADPRRGDRRSCAARWARRASKVLRAGQRADRGHLPLRGLHRLPDHSRPTSWWAEAWPHSSGSLDPDDLAADRRPAGRHRPAPGAQLPRRRRHPPARAHRVRTGGPFHAVVRRRLGHPGAGGGGRPRRPGAPGPRCWARTRDLAAAVASRVAAKLAREPIEDLRLDFEDGYGDRGDDAEDADAVAAAAGRRPPPLRPVPPRRSSASGSSASRRPPGPAACGPWTCSSPLWPRPANCPTGLILTLPKVTTVAQVQAMDFAVSPAGGSPLASGGPAPLRGPGGNAAADPRPGRHVPGGAASARRPGPDQRTALRHVRLQRLAADLRGVPVHGAPRGRLRQGSHAAGRGRDRASGCPTVPPTSSRWATTWRTRGGCTAGWCGVPWNAATTRAGTCTRPSCRAGSRPPTRSTARACPPPRPGCATTWSAPRAASWTNPPPPGPWPHFVLRGVQCGAVGAEEVQALAGVELPQLTAWRTRGWHTSTSK